MAQASPMQVLAGKFFLIWLLAGSAHATEGPAHCQFFRPDGWTESVLRWTGNCRAGLAHGRGVLRAYVGNKVNRLFFGRLQDGQIHLGVIEQPTGYQAGKFKEGKLMVTDDRAITIDAFSEASKAADEAAKRFERQRNGSSAAYYAGKAKELAVQMD